MSVPDMFHEGSRHLQDRFGTRALADRIVEVAAHTAFTEGDRQFIESRPMFFLATANAQGHPDCSYKGGMPGFIRVTGPDELAFPSYDGNGMFKSLGNISVNPSVGLLFIDFESPRRLRVNGIARVDMDDPLLRDFEGAQGVVRVRAQAIFPNCPRYIHPVPGTELSVHAPRVGHVPPPPEWKTRPQYREVLPASDPLSVRAGDPSSHPT